MNDKDAQRLWAPFLNCTLEEQDQMLQELSTSNPQTPGGDCLSNTKLQRVPKRFIDPLLRCTKNAFFFAFLCSLEVKLQHYLHLLGSLDRSASCDWEYIVKTTNFTEEGKPDQVKSFLALERDRFPSLNLELGSSYHRLLCHGLCSYYGVLSESITDGAGVRVTQVRLNKTLSKLEQDWFPQIPRENLSSYILRFQE